MTHPFAETAEDGLSAPVGTRKFAGTAAASPCVGVCKLDEATDVCHGCLRTADEIARWRDADDHWRREVLKRILRRRAKQVLQI